MLDSRFKTMHNPISTISGTPINSEQSIYLNGFFNGLQQTGMRFADVAPDPALSDVSNENSPEDYCKEEQLKYRTDLNKTFSLVQNVSEQRCEPNVEETFLMKWHGLFYLAPKQDGFMCRLRIPGGYIRSFQIRELAALSKELTSGYIQITTRANFQLRVIPLEHASSVLQRIQSVGLHSKGSGADNIRNITASPAAGIDPTELIDVRPFCLKLAQRIINTDEFYNLPRKFNIAFDGGGAIGVVEDTNDIGVRAVKVNETFKGCIPGVYFLMALGGVTGHKTFASDSGVLIPPDQLLEIIQSIVRIFIENGNRALRKKARLKYLLKDWGIDRFLNAVEQDLNSPLIKLNESDIKLLRSWNPPQPVATKHAHIGSHPQKQEGLFYVGIGIPAGVLTPEQLNGLADLSDRFGNGELRLTVWQNLLIPNVTKEDLDSLTREVVALGLHVEPSNIRSGVIACTGNSYCKFASANTKGHARELMDYLEERCPMECPINIHLTGCSHSCAQHYIGDIGLLATQVKSGDTTKEGYHVFVGGGFGDQKEIGRQIAKAVAFDDLPLMLERLLKKFNSDSWPQESFQSFTQRQSVETMEDWIHAATEMK